MGRRRVVERVISSFAGQSSTRTESVRFEEVEKKARLRDLPCSQSWRDGRCSSCRLEQVELCITLWEWTGHRISN